MTNQRELHCGGRGGNQINAMVYPPQPSRYRVVAFAGIFKGVLELVGFYAKSIPWEIVREYVMLRWIVDMLRWIVDMNHASVIDQPRTRLRRCTNQDRQLGNIAIRWLMIEAPIVDLLPIVLSFLF